MAGLYHDFCVIGKEEKNLFDFYNKKDNIRIHDDWINYMYDSLSWLESTNPYENNELCRGLCLYGVTIIEGKSLLKFKNILSAWVLLVKEAPLEMTLTGYYIKTDELNNGYYEQLKCNKNDLISRLKRVIILCDEAYNDNKNLLHIGI